MFNIVSWYTKDTPYEEIIHDRLIASLNRLDLSRAIYQVEDLGNWIDNTNQKPSVAMRALTDLRTDIVLLDADCEVHEYPVLFDNIPQHYDMAVFYLDWKTWYKKQSDRKELCSGTLFFRNRERCKKLIQDWHFESHLYGNKLPDQRVLEDLLKKNKHHLRIMELPISYCWINSLPDGSKPHVEKPLDVTIEHFQASRKLRRDR